MSIYRNSLISSFKKEAFIGPALAVAARFGGPMITRGVSALMRVKNLKGIGVKAVNTLSMADTAASLTRRRKQSTQGPY